VAAAPEMTLWGRGGGSVKGDFEEERTMEKLPKGVI